jgi:hypothetical protein
LDEVVEQLRRDPSRPVRTTVGDLTVEVRAVTACGTGSAADAFAALGPWAGESTDEILSMLAEARRQGGQRPVSSL